MPDHMVLCEEIAMLFSEKLNISVPDQETDLIASGHLDSLAFVELLLQLEQTFGIEFSVDELELDSFRSIDRIALFVESHNRVKELTGAG